MASSDLTELESCALAVIGRDGPCTRYHVMRIFAASQTSRWSSTAGSIYPLIRRLIARGMIEEIPGTKGSGQIGLSDTGRATVQRWIVSPTADLGGPIDDPIRTRSFFLNAVSSAESAAARGMWRDQTLAALARCEEQLAEFDRAGDTAQIQATRGTRRQLKARLDWLDNDFG
jgi:DNA-binding PadR family transcriptional regulator